LAYTKQGEVNMNNKLFDISALVKEAVERELLAQEYGRAAEEEQLKYGFAEGHPWNTKDAKEEKKIEDYNLWDYPTEEEDIINSPSHYTEGGIETIDFIEAKLGYEGAYHYCIGNVFKYISRAGKKDFSTQTQDLNKAGWYLDRAISYC
jgi:hypothetical protein